MNPAHCRLCGLAPNYCICAGLETVPNKTLVTVLMHTLEQRRPSNTAKLLTRVLARSDLRLYGQEGAQIDWTSLIKTGHRNLLLYPVTNRYDPPEGDEPIHLIVPDGNWRQAGKMARQLLQLTEVTPVALPLGAPSQYLLRSAVNRPEALATFEAVASYLSHLEGKAIGAELMSVFRHFVKQHLTARCKFALMREVGMIERLAP